MEVAAPEEEAEKEAAAELEDAERANVDALLGMEDDAAAAADDEEVAAFVCLTLRGDGDSMALNPPVWLFRTDRGDASGENVSEE